MGVFLRDREPKRFKRHPYGPLRMRLVLAVLCVVVGALLAIGSLPWLGLRDDQGLSALFLWGIGLIVLGVAGFFVARWMAKRNL